MCNLLLRVYERCGHKDNSGAFEKCAMARRAGALCVGVTGVSLRRVPSCCALCAESLGDSSSSEGTRGTSNAGAVVPVLSTVSCACSGLAAMHMHNMHRRASATDYPRSAAAAAGSGTGACPGAGPGVPRGMSMNLAGGYAASPAAVPSSVSKK